MIEEGLVLCPERAEMLVYRPDWEAILEYKRVMAGGAESFKHHLAMSEECFAYWNNKNRTQQGQTRQQFRQFLYWYSQMAEGAIQQSSLIAFSPEPKYNERVRYFANIGGDNLVVCDGGETKPIVYYRDIVEVHATTVKFTKTTRVRLHNDVGAWWRQQDVGLQGINVLFFWYWSNFLKD